MDKIIEELEAIQRLINAEEYKEANTYIDRIKKDILNKQDAGQYIDDLVSNLK